MKKLLYITAAALAMTACNRTNPFLAEWNTPYGIPPFDQIQFADYVPAVKAGIEQQQAEIDAIIANQAAPDFDNTIAALELSGDILSKVTGVLFNVSETENCPELEAIVEEITPLTTAHEDNIWMNRDLYLRVKAVADADQSALSAEQKMVLKETLQKFE
ncbi:MAG: peptidase M3, partial [Bacteroidales bacterium]|nr:peptidase M3 [Bacteroidales bacterium]